MKFYILHEAHSLCDYNDHEVFTDYATAKKFFELSSTTLNQTLC